MRLWRKKKKKEKGVKYEQGQEMEEDEQRNKDTKEQSGEDKGRKEGGEMDEQRRWKRKI